MKLNPFTLGLFVVSLTTACDAKEECIADCGGTSSNSDPGDESGTLAPMCEDFTAQADAFIEANRTCETLLDCVGVDGGCYHGEAPRPCGEVAVSADADLTAWAVIQDGMADSCKCGAADCGSVVVCNAQQECESTFGLADLCPSVARDAETFLAANRACESDEDCVALDSTCRVDECSIVAVNIATSAEDWARIDGMLGGCQDNDASGEWCNYVGECAPAIRCGDDGQCIAEF